MPVKSFLIASGLAPLLGVVLLLLMARLDVFAGSTPPDLGVHDGRLKPPSSTRNSVSSQAGLSPDSTGSRYAQIAPLPLKGSSPDPLAVLAGVLAQWPGAVIIERGPDYLRATFTTRWMRFVDDVEFLAVPGEGVIHVRSASRLGLEDLGTNHRRVEDLRSALLKAGGAASPP